MRQKRNNARAELYYLKKGGETEVLGPFAVIMLRQMIERGEVKRDDEISRDQVKWVMAETTAPKLFRRLMRPNSDMQDAAEDLESKKGKPALRASIEVKRPSGDEDASQDSPSSQKVKRLLATVQRKLSLTSFMGKVNARLCISQFFSEIASVLTWRSASSMEMESQKTTAQLLSTGLFTQVLVVVLTQASGGVLVFLSGILLTPVYVAARVFTAFWISSLFGVFVEWRGNILQREISLTGLLMVSGGVLELILEYLAFSATVAMNISVTVGATLHVYFKCVLFMRFLMSQSTGSQEFNGRLFWLGVVGQFVVTITFMLLIAASAALCQMSVS